MFSMCSEHAPRARIPDTRIPQLMQPCQYENQPQVFVAIDFGEITILFLRKPESEWRSRQVPRTRQLHQGILLHLLLLTKRELLLLLHLFPMP